MKHATARALLLRLAAACGLLLGLGGTAQAQGPALPEPQGEVLLEIHGAIARTNAEGAARFDRAMLEALPRSQLDTHTSVTDGVHHFEGVLLRDLLEYVQADGSRVRATALNDYAIELDMDEFHRYDVLAAWAMDGRVLQPTDKGPLWIVYPRDAHPELQDIRYDYRWVWQLVRLDVQ
ncbi:MAG: molybdopterin-dependent oxidoreductase [Ottowia sp.]|nr:molybdopterin-dependent oxidoreductase [Ottowia sp.]